MGIPAIAPYSMPSGGSLPVNTAQWEVDPRRAMLLIHDMQEYFLHPFAAGRQPLTDLLANSAALRDRCAELDIPVAFTAQPGDMTEADRGLLKDFWGPGMTVSSADRAIAAALAPAERDTVHTKWRPSAFFRTDLLERLRASGRDQLIVCGVYAHVGILTTANEAFAHDIQTFVVADAVADFTPEFHRMTVDYVAARCGMAVSTRDVLERLASFVTETVR
ncbi:isochorismatase family protein [Streptomyces sp. H34-S4]|uniref:isochorismatase family protein n=1 Tax=Streptomyces sp. H34-S4 TaxID=2996463 RepID=UPI002270BFF5|nr:isochorismatase family protein [Streptomyces sp. H34-S4]MCY0935124.1 isochorismatase family protein [Streptomyces sp. H34-S4]